GAMLVYEPRQCPNGLLVALDITGAKLPRHLDLDLTFTGDDQAVTDIDCGQLIVPHRCGDSLIHSVARVLQIDQDDTQRLWDILAQQRTTTCHCQRLNDRQRALASTTHRGGTSNFTAQQKPPI